MAQSYELEGNFTVLWKGGRGVHGKCRADGSGAVARRGGDVWVRMYFIARKYSLRSTGEGETIWAMRVEGVFFLHTVRERVRVAV